MKYYHHELTKNEFMLHILKVGEEEAAKDFKCTMLQLHMEMERLRHLYDAEAFAAKRLKITDQETGLITPFRFNGGQKKLNDAVERQKMANKPVRIKLLKARQWGGSTYWASLLYRDNVLRPLRNSMVVAHDLDSARHIRDMISRYYEYDIYPKPRMKKETDKWWKVQHFIEGKRASSNLRIDTAEEISIGHSLTNQNLHLSEIQLWRNAQVLVKGLFPTVKDYPDTMILMEGTGSGVGDYWYDQCEAARSGLTEWEFVFVAWYEVEWYRMNFDNLDERAGFEASLDSEEKVLSRQGVSLEQLYWRRYKIENTYKGDTDSFRQQYPATADEAFLTSGRPVFSPVKVKEAIARAKPPLKIGNLEWSEGKIKFIGQEKGMWEIWEEPLEGIQNLYVMGADVAEGIAVIPELGTRGGDFCCAKILRRDTRRMVARLHDRIDPDLFADEIYKASLYWQGVGVLVENNPGGSGNVVIRDLKDKTTNLLKTVTLDKIHDTRKEQYGWDTNKESKREMIDELNELIREERFIDLSKNFWYEASTYIKDEKGRTNAQPRKFDDEVVAVAVAFQGDKLMPMLFKGEAKKRDEDSYTWDSDEKRKPVTQREIMAENYV